MAITTSNSIKVNPARAGRGNSGKHRASVIGFPPDESNQCRAFIEAELSGIAVAQTIPTNIPTVKLAPMDNPLIPQAESREVCEEIAAIG
jgi:hypothetical protein